MKNKYIKNTLTLLLVFSIILALCACSSVSAGDVIGIWSGAWEYNGNRINCSFELLRTGEYYDITYINGEMNPIETGTYIINGNKVILQVGGDPGYTKTYTYSRGVLKNGGHTLSKE